MTALYAVGLTIDQIQAEVDALRKNSADAEAAHGSEDALHQVVLEAIAINQLSGAEAQRAALVALETKRLAFPRWCA